MSTRVPSGMVSPAAAAMTCADRPTSLAFGSRCGVTEDAADGASLCEACRWELDNPGLCPEGIEDGTPCGGPKEANESRCARCEAAVWDEE